MFRINWKKELMTIPNMLSLFRIILIPVYIMIFIKAAGPMHYFLSASILALSCLTDLLDGKIARKFHMESTVGRILDPLADKLTQFSLILTLSVRYRTLQILMVLFLIKEIFQLVAGIITLRNGKILKCALLTGKVCTTVLFISLILLILFPQMTQTSVSIIAGVDCICLSIAFGDYIKAYFGKKGQIEELPPP